jgi:hypothetical protein
MSVVASRFDAGLDGPRKPRTRHERVIVHILIGSKGSPAPHVAPPLTIVLVWRIEGNLNGNVLLIFVKVSDTMILPD